MKKSETHGHVCIGLRTFGHGGGALDDKLLLGVKFEFQEKTSKFPR